MSAHQLAFDLPASSSFARDDFLIADCNRSASSLVENWPRWPDRVLILIGPPGSGKSHLASIWAARAQARRIASASDIALSSASDADPICALLDDADRLALDETKLFHLLNLVRSGPGWLMATARGAPDRWNIQTPDLLSRLRLASTARLDEPDEGLMRVLLAKLFVDRQLAVDASTIEYLALRLDRSFDAARRIVDALDREALARSRPITRPLVAEVLNGVNGSRAD